jgi:hypothetical protein
MGDLTVLVGAYFSLMLLDNREDAAARLLIWSGVLVGDWLAFALHQGAYPTIGAGPSTPQAICHRQAILSGAVFHLLPLVGGPVKSRIASIAVVIALVGPLIAWRLLLSRLAAAGAPLRDLVVVGAG